MQPETELEPLETKPGSTDGADGCAGVANIDEGDDQPEKIDEEQAVYLCEMEWLKDFLDHIGMPSDWRPELKLPCLSQPWKCSFSA